MPLVASAPFNVNTRWQSICRALFVILIAASWLDGYAQSLSPSARPPTSLPRCEWRTGAESFVWTNCIGMRIDDYGTRYEGEFINGTANGYGVRTTATGHIYDGQFLNNQMHGRGVEALAERGQYVGYFAKGLYNGFGILYGPDGSVRQSGQWSMGELLRSIPLDTSEFPFRVDLAGPMNAGQISTPEPAQIAKNNTPSATTEAHTPQRLNRRVALVIGNARYTNASVLTNPPSDASSIASALRDVGFQIVIVKNDLSQQAILTSLREFAALSDSADWAVVYYAGHGIEFGGVNYLIPTDARLKTDRDIDLEGVDLGKVLAAVEGAKRLRLIILDACRDNPFASQMRRTIASRSIGKGLARVEPEPGTLIAYAAKHGETAIDGVATRNSPFAEALVKRIRQTPPIEVRRLFDYVRDDVLRATSKRQQPFSYGSISAEEDFYFSQPK